MNPHTAGLHHDRANGCIGIRPNEWLLAAVAHSNAAALVAATARPWPSLSHHGSSLESGHRHALCLRPGFGGVSYATQSADQFADDP